ncbi:tetratricopeptide repeat protein [Cetobacterium sp.]|uniref:tetratricopeptide repeat protein n=1 Tax=Cetobacterium sp. TaxID=2071632 RepID=UPI003F332278
MIKKIMMILFILIISLKVYPEDKKLQESNNKNNILKMDEKLTPLKNETNENEKKNEELFKYLDQQIKSVGDEVKKISDYGGIIYNVDQIYKGIVERYEFKFSILVTVLSILGALLTYFKINGEKQLKEDRDELKADTKELREKIDENFNKLESKLEKKINIDIYQSKKDLTEKTKKIEDDLTQKIVKSTDEINQVKEILIEEQKINNEKIEKKVIEFKFENEKNLILREKNLEERKNLILRFKEKFDLDYKEIDRKSKLSIYLEEIEIKLEELNLTRVKKEREEKIESEVEILNFIHGLYEEIIDKFGISEEIYLSKIKLFKNLDDEKKVIEYYEKLIKLDGKKESFYYRGMAEYQKNKKNYEEALSYCESSIELNPNSPSIYILLGSIYKELNRMDDAIESCNKAINLDPKNSWFYYKKAEYLLDKDGDEALKNYSKAILLEQNSSFYYYARGIAKDKLKYKDEDILEDYNKSLKYDSKNGFVYCLRGNIYKSKNMYFEALNDYTQAIELESSISYAYYCRFWLYVENKKNIEAISDYTELRKFDSEILEVEKKVIDIYIELEEYEEAMKICDILHLKGDNEIFLKKYYIMQKLGQFDDLLSELEKNKDKNEELYLIGSGDLFAGIGELSKALEYYEKALVKVECYEKQEILYKQILRIKIREKKYSDLSSLQKKFKEDSIYQNIIQEMISVIENRLENKDIYNKLEEYTVLEYEVLGYFYMEFDLKKAEDYIKKVIELSPEKSEFYNVLGVINEKNGNKLEALRNYNFSIEDNIYNITAHLNKIDLKIDEKNYDSALRDLDKIEKIKKLEETNEYSRYLALRVISHTEKKEFLEAILYSEKMAKLKKVGSEYENLLNSLENNFEKSKNQREKENLKKIINILKTK